MATRKTNSTTTRNTTTKKATTTSRIPAAVSSPAPKAAAAPKTAASAPVKTITQAERQKLIEQAAYFKAEKAGFQGNPQDHWNAAQEEVTADLAKKKIRVV